MSEEKRIYNGMYFEEFEVGYKVTTASRTITEADVVGFAQLSGDFNMIHTSAEFAESTPYGQRIAHGLLGLSIASGLVIRTGFLEDTVIAFREISGWKFIGPIFLGETIHATIQVKETKALPRLGGGSVTTRVDVIKQNGDTVMRGNWVVLVRGRPEGTE